MKSRMTRSTCAISSLVGMLALAGCGGPSMEGEAEVESTGAALISDRYAYSYKPTSSWYSQASATFTVPPNPAGSHGQTLYYYVGLWNSSAMTNGITAQLRYNGGTWTIRTCSGVHSCTAGQVVYPGDAIYAQISETGCNSTGVCSWTAFLEDWTYPHNVAVSASYTPGVAFKFATPWVEQVNNLTACSDLPATDPISATGTLYKGANHDQDTGAWSAWNNGSSSPACYPNTLIGPNPGRTDIYQTPWP